jgi:dipeptidase E
VFGNWFVLARQTSEAQPNHCHLDHEKFPENSLANAEKWAAKGPVPTYAIDDQTAIKVIDGAVEVVSEGHWKRFVPL